MAKAIIARIQGDDYQALFFWLKCCELLIAPERVEKVAFEQDGVKSFDDVVVYYKSGTVLDKGDQIDTDYFQVKFHVTAEGAFTWDGMTDPAFINAASISLLQRLHNAQKAFAPDGKRARFNLYTPWSVHPEDPLAAVLSYDDGSLRLDPFFVGGAKSKLGKIRAAWCKHLGLKDEADLRTVLLPLRLVTGGILKQLEDSLDGRLRIAGLTPLEKGKSINKYTELTRRLMAAGQVEFDRPKLIEICKQEGIWNGGPIDLRNAPRIAVRTFMRGTANLRDSHDQFLDLTDAFDARRLKGGKIWLDDVVKPIRGLVETLQGNRRVHLTLATHASVAFIAGYLLDSKMGVDVLLSQNIGFGLTLLWNFQDSTVDANSRSTWKVDQKTLGPAPDVAVAISLTHNIAADVETFLKRELPKVGRLIHVIPTTGAGSGSVLDGRHARDLAEGLVGILREHRTLNERNEKLHIFVAAPNGFVFSLGRLSRALGQIVTYEHDFEALVQPAYSPTISLP